MVSVLQEVGGVRPENTVLLQGKDADTVRRALIAVNERVRTAGRPTVLLVYYSGHADAGALHLGGSRLELAELEQLVRGSAAGIPAAGPRLPAARGRSPASRAEHPSRRSTSSLGERVAGEGAVFLTSSSASEDSQESDELKGSFFTHALLSGLLGAADENRDGRVTLDEAYRYAYETTLRASSRTLAGTQHPTFQYDVRGSGDLVLATLDARSPTRAWLELPPGKSWLLFQENADGAVVGEVASADRVRRLSLRAGTVLRPWPRAGGAAGGNGGGRARARTSTVDESKLQRTAYARLVRKGQGEPGLGRVARGRGAVPHVAGQRCRACAPASAWGWRSPCGRSRSCPGSPGAGPGTPTRGSRRRRTSRPRASGLVRLGPGPGVDRGAGSRRRSLLHQSFSTDGSAPPRTTAALQLSPIGRA